MCLLGQFISKCQTRVSLQRMVTGGDSSSLWLTSWPLRVLRGQLACQWTRPSGHNWDPFVPGLILMWTTGQSAPTGKEQETLLISLPFSFLSFILPILPLFSSPLVLDAGIWLKGLDLSWGLEIDTSSWERTRILVGQSFSHHLSGSPGESPVMPGCLQVAGDVCKDTPFATSPASSPFFFQPGFLSSLWNLWRPEMFSFTLLVLGSEVPCLRRRFSERLYSCT